MRAEIRGWNPNGMYTVTRRCCSTVRVRYEVPLPWDVGLWAVSSQVGWVRREIGSLVTQVPSGNVDSGNTKMPNATDSRRRDKRNPGSCGPRCLRVLSVGSSESPTRQFIVHGSIACGPTPLCTTLGTVPHHSTMRRDAVQTRPFASPRLLDCGTHA